MTVDYNNFAKTFSNSRKNMKWEEIEYFISFLPSPQPSPLSERELSILDIWCWNGRFLSFLKTSPLAPLLKEEGKITYLWIDLSEKLLEEANFLHPEARFLHLNMLQLEKIKEKFTDIFLIASFHHLDNLEDRKKVMKDLFNILENWWKIFMTNWALNSELNKEKYKNSQIKNSKNKFWSLDYNIKIWKFNRYYHCFNLSELEYLAKEAWFKIIENRLFENKRNFITILEK